MSVDVHDEDPQFVIEMTCLGNGQLVAQARAKPAENRKLVSAGAFVKNIVGRMDDDADILGRILDDPAFQSVVMDPLPAAGSHTSAGQRTRRGQ
jgi:hypothetical protein